MYLEWKDRDVTRNNFLVKFPKFADEHGLIHPGHNPAFQVTNRISVTKPPLSNMDRRKEVRGIIASRFDEGKILTADYKQLEMRLLASESNEERMLTMFSSGKDVHDETALTMFGQGFTKEDRDIAKAINFSTVYGIEKFSFSRKYHKPVGASEEWLKLHREIYPNIYRWMEEQHRFIRSHGWISSRFGLRRRLPEALNLDPLDDESLLLAIFRQAGNFPTQSQGAAITNLAGVKLDYKLDQMWEFKSKLYHIHHDSLNVDCYFGEEDRVAQITKEVMEVEVPAICPWLKVKLTVDIKISERWGA